MSKLTLGMILLAAPLAWAGPPADASVRLFKAKCASCHGADGKAQTANGQKLKIRDMSAAAWQAEHSDAALNELLSTNQPVKANGAETPHFSAKLKPNEVTGLIEVIRSLAAK